MTDISEELDHLRAENSRLKAYINSLTTTSNGHGFKSEPSIPSHSETTDHHCMWDGIGHGLDREQIGRYSRQIILPHFGISAQAKLCNGSVLIIGAGGLGSPAAIYLAAAGVGRIGIVDKDTVELSNIHRQVIHTEASVGTHKADSAATFIQSLNSSVKIEIFKNGFTPENAVDLVSDFDVILDASDNAPTRYLISDACCVAHKPLVSGAAIGTDGQLTVYCHGDDGPCYRCVFPTAPLPRSCSRCVDAGVLGVVPGIIGTMQALEAIKILSGVGQPMSRKLLIMDSLSSRFHVVTLRAKSTACISCGENAEITAENLKEYDYAAFTGQTSNDAAPAPLQLIKQEERITPSQLQAKLAGSDINEEQTSSSPTSNAGVVVLDVRPPEQFAICHLPGAVNIPWKVFDKHLDAIKERVSSSTKIGKEATATAAAVQELYVVCRRGNDSQRAVARLRDLGLDHAVDMVGGMEAWGKEVDPTFPIY
jgi:adenylyltransferase/sulfurtransferase